MSLGSYSLGSSPLGGGAGIPPSISGDANLASVLATFGPPHRALIPPASPIPQQGYMIMLWLYGGISPAPPVVAALFVVVDVGYVNAMTTDDGTVSVKEENEGYA